MTKETSRSAEDPNGSLESSESAGSARSAVSRTAGVVAAATMVSRVFGLVRDAVRAALVGARSLSDALNVAFKIPNLLRDLFAEGAFSGAFVPTLAAVREREGDDAAWQLFNRVWSTLTVYVGFVVVLLIVGAPTLVEWIASYRFVHDSGYFDLTVLLVRLLAPFLLFISLAVAAMGALNVWGRFFVPALVPALQNVLLVGGGVLLLTIGWADAEAAVPWAVLLLAGGFVQCAAQIPALRRAGWRPRWQPDWRLAEGSVREIVRRMGPVVGGMAAAHICILINTKLATRVEGGDSNLYYAFRLVHLPVGLVGVAVGTAFLAQASKLAARGQRQELGNTLRESLLVCTALAAPAAAGLWALGEPLARLLFEWGRLDADQSRAIGTTIRYYAPAVVFYSAVKVAAPGFYAQGRVRIPLYASLTAVAANLVVAFSLEPTLRHRGLALAIGAGQAANLAVLLAVAKKDFGSMSARTGGRLAKIALASGLCGAAAWGAARLCPDSASVAARAARALLPVGAGAAVYFGAATWLRCPEIKAIADLFRRRRGGARR